MPNPKRRHSCARRDRRRTHDALVAINSSICSNCKSSKISHNVCPTCGFYRGRKVLNVESV